MNKYQETLNAIRTNYGTHSEYYKTVKELVDQTKTPTLEEVKKEWEEKGWYEYYKGKNHIHFRYLNESGSYDEYIFHPTKLYYVANDTKVTYEMFQLISKTLKALEVEYE